MTQRTSLTSRFGVPTENRSPAMLNAMTVDVEDYFQVQAFTHRIPRTAWDHIPRRVEANVDTLLALFSANDVTATFFTLGWIAERHPEMLRRVAAAGHELASHGYDHTPVTRLSPAHFREDIRRTKTIIEDIIASAVLGYRAPTFSIGPAIPWAYGLLEEEGYRYSSSLYPIRHDIYGDPNAPRQPFRPECRDIWEFPLTTRRLFGQNLPSSGGGYFRLTPYWLWRRNLHHLNNAENVSCIFYMHPWEIDTRQPRVPGIDIRTQLRHYTNIDAMAGRLSRVVKDFRWGRMDQAFAHLLTPADERSPL